MSADPAGQAGDPAVGSGGGPGESSEEELRAAYEAELSRISSADVILQAAVSLLNLGGHRLGLAPGAEGEPRDLEQVRDAIDGVRALLGILERSAPEELRPLRDALSQLQMAYAREAGAGAAEASAPKKPPADAPKEQPAEKKSAPAAADKPGAGPAESSGRLWVPGR